MPRSFLFWFFLICSSFFMSTTLASPEIDVPKLKYLLKHDCGSCHGMRLSGGLGLPLNQLGQRNQQELSLIILHGRIGTAMPAWKSLLSEAEAKWLAHFLISNSGKDFQKVLD